MTVRSAIGNGDAGAIGGDAAGRLVPSRQDEGINRVDEATAAYGGVNGGSKFSGGIDAGDPLLGAAPALVQRVAVDCGRHRVRDE